MTNQGRGCAGYPPLHCLLDLRHHLIWPKECCITPVFFFGFFFCLLMKVNKGSILHGKTLSSKLHNLIIKKGKNCPGKLLAFHLSLSCKLAISGSHNKARLGREHSLLPWLRRPSPSGLITRKRDGSCPGGGARAGSVGLGWRLTDRRHSLSELTAPR